MSLSAETITAIKESVPLIAQNAEAITKVMYDILFSKYPQTKALFANAAPDQHKKLAAAVGAYAANIDNLAVLGNAVEKMAHSHVNSGVKPEHYPMVADALLGAMGDVLGEAFTDARKKAWTEAYLFLAGILIKKEEELYSQTA